MPSYGLVESVDALRELVDKLIAEAKPIGFDIETGYDGEDKNGASLHPEEGFIVGFSFTNDRRWARYVPLRHDFSNNLPPREVAVELWRMLSTGLGVAHNAKFELRWLRRFFVEHLQGTECADEVNACRGYFPVRSDTMIEAYVLSNWRSVGLKSLTKEVFGHEQAELASLFPGSKKNAQKAMRFNVLALTPEVVDYACEDAGWCLALHDAHYPQVRDNFIYKLEMQILPILCDMEDWGLKYDWTMMGTRAVEVENFIAALNVEIMADLTELAGKPVNINLGSPKQVSEVLFDELGMKTTRYTKSSVDTDTPKMSTDAVALEGLSQRYPVVRKILDWKELKKLHGTYLVKYEREYAYADDGRTHPGHLQTAVGSGRFAVSDPPYQQTPKKYHYELSSGREFDFNFRDVVIADEGHYLLGYDYSQVELRVMAGEAQEPALLAAFNNDEDVHTRTASLMFHVPMEEVSKDLRSKGKTLNFALLYQMGIKGLADRLGISNNEAKELYDSYFDAYSSIKLWSERTVAQVTARGYSMSHFGRKCMIWELQSDIRGIYAKGERLAVNAPIQGGAADYMKVAMVRAHRALREAGMLDKVHLVMNIHDALIFEVRRDVKPGEVIKVLQKNITFPVKGWPKVVADWSMGLRWGTMKDLDVTGDGRLLGLKGAERAEAKAEAAEPDSAPQEPTESACEAVWTMVAQSGREPAPVEPEISPMPDDTTEREVHVRIMQMPTGEQYARFCELIRTSPGYHTVVLQTPEGDLTMDERSALSPDHAPIVSMTLGGAEVKWAPQSVNPDLVTSGLEL